MPATTRRLMRAAALCLLLAGCEGGFAPSAELETRYGEARASLEAGRNEDAARSYAAALEAPGAGGVEAQLRLERAHALLRLRRPDEAAAEARRAAELARDPPTGRDARLALGVALHDSVRARPGARDEAAETALREAYELLREAAGTHPGPAARNFASARLGEVREDLARLELARLADDLAAGDAATARERAGYIEAEYGGTAAATASADLLRRARAL